MDFKKLARNYILELLDLKKKKFYILSNFVKHVNYQIKICETRFRVNNGKYY